MKIQNLSYLASSGWSIQPFPDLDSERTLILAFGAPRFGDDSGPLSELWAPYPKSSVVGCSTSEEIHGQELMDDSISVAIVRFDATDVSSAHATVEFMGDSLAAGEAPAAQLTSDDLKAIPVLSDGLNVSGSDLVRGLNSGVDTSVVITGGMARDGERFGETWVIYDGQAKAGIVTAAGLHGDRVRVSHGQSGGWRAFGPVRTVTHSEGNVLYEIDNRPALELYMDYLGEYAAELPASALRFPLALRSPDHGDEVAVRTILSVDMEQLTMTFAGDVPTGSSVQLMRDDTDSLIDGAYDAAANGRSGASDATALTIAISCVGRRMVLGERTEEEIESVTAEMGPGTCQLGFYSYGEIAPIFVGSPSLHNQTFCLTTISED